MLENIGNHISSENGSSARSLPSGRNFSQEKKEEQVSSNNLLNRDYSDRLDFSYDTLKKGEGQSCSCGKCEQCRSRNALGSDKANDLSPKGTTAAKELSQSDKKKVDELKKRDQEVKTHEKAHVTAGASNPQYEYETGPDGEKYATGGHADIEVSEGNTPEETIAKAQKVKKAALAPAEPSAQDRKIAAEAEKMETEAKKEMLEANGEEESEVSGSGINGVESGNDNDASAIGKKKAQLLKGYQMFSSSTTPKGSLLDFAM